MNKFKKIALLLTLVTTLSVAMTACGSKTSDSAAKSTDEVRTIKVGYVTNGYPIAYTDEQGNVTGCDIEGMKLVDELLPDYQFEYVALDQNAIYAGLQSGKLQVALTNSFWTPEREEKYLFPKENLGASVVGLFTRTADGDVKNLEQAAAKNLKLSPILAGDGLYYVVEAYNKEHPDAQIALTPTDDVNSFSNQFPWVVEGRYDFGLTPKYYYDVLVGDQAGSFNQYKDQLQFTPFTAVKTWSILAKGEDKFAGELDTALKQLKSEGKLVELAKKFQGYNTFEYLDSNSK